VKKAVFQGYSVYHVNGMRCGTCSLAGDSAA
jgi:hypothetical protein